MKVNSHDIKLLKEHLHLLLTDPTARGFEMFVRRLKSFVFTEDGEALQEVFYDYDGAMIAIKARAESEEVWSLQNNNGAAVHKLMARLAERGEISVEEACRWFADKNNPSACLSVFLSRLRERGIEVIRENGMIKMNYRIVFLPGMLKDIPIQKKVIARRNDK